nr:HAD hydrolase-like protein [Pectobacterium sp. PL152]
MVGDRKDDIIGARDNHLSSIGVLWGTGHMMSYQRTRLTTCVTNRISCAM